MMLRRALAQSRRRSSTTTQQRPVVKQLLNAIRKTPWWAGGDVERNRTLFEELMERGNARCPHLGSTHEATTTDKGGVRITPRDGDAKATLCFVHGGGFFAGSPHAYRGAVASLIARVPGGCSALLPKYRRAPEFTIADAVDDIIEQYNELTGPIVLAGDSAGAYLCLRAAQQLQVKPAGVLLWCPYLLHHPTKDVQRSLSSEGDFLDVSSLQPARHVNDEQNDARHAYALTASNVDDMMIISGEQETLHVDALTLALTAKASDTNVTHKTYEEMFHDFVLFPKFLKEVRSRRPRCCGAFTPSTRVVSRNDGSGWFLCRVLGHSDRTAMLHAGRGRSTSISGVHRTTVRPYHRNRSRSITAGARGSPSRRGRGAFRSHFRRHRGLGEARVAFRGRGLG